MAFDEIQTQRIKNVVCAYVERHRPPASIRAQVDLAFRLTGQSVELFEIRPPFQGSPGEILELPFAKATFVRTSSTWRVFWRRADLKWHAYPPEPHVESVERFLYLVEQDSHACFRG